MIATVADGYSIGLEDCNETNDDDNLDDTRKDNRNRDKPASSCNASVDRHEFMINNNPSEEAKH